MVRKLTNLRVDEISSVDKGAGEGVQIILMKRHGDTPHRERLRQIFNKVKAAPPQPPFDEEIEDDEEQSRIPDEDIDNGDDMGDTDRKLSPQLEQAIAALILVNPVLTKQEAAHFLLNKPHGRAMIEHLSKVFNERKEQPMDRQTELHSIVKSHGGVAAMAKLFVASNKSYGISEGELTGLIFEEAKKHALPGERPNSAFARYYSAPENIELRKAVQIAKSTPVAKSYPQLLDLQPTQVGGADFDVNDSTKAYQALLDMANELRARSPELTVAQAFAQVFTETKNAELAAKAHKRPTPTTGYAFPYERVI